jgi:hypothetical protein
MKGTLRELYPDVDIVCKIRVKDREGTCICDDLETDRTIYSANLVATDEETLKKAIEGAIEGLKEIPAWKFKKFKKVYL